jgi:glycosyltransferase involved in cell wall biosynthesis
MVVRHLADQLVSSGAEVTVVTGNSNTGQAEALPLNQAVTVVHVANGSGGWRSALKAALLETPKTGRAIQNDTVIHDFGLWRPANHAVACTSAALAIPFISSTSGMLAPWALRHKRWKKRLGWWSYQRRDLLRATLVAATSRQEVRDIRNLVPKKPVALVPNGVALPARARTWNSKPRETRKAVFLGRIHPVKGLQNLVEAWRRVRPSGWRCILAGPDECNHRSELEALLSSQDSRNSFEFIGPLDDEKKWALLNDADLFVLPSFTENFGIAAAEALAAGVPVIATKGTPWEELIAWQCGWWVDIGLGPLATALREATALPSRVRYEMGQRGRRLVEEQSSWRQSGLELVAV